jgi:hypothetical protein
MAGCCKGTPQRAPCAPACPPLPCTPDWTVTAFAASAPAIVAVADRFGSVIGSGFWATATSIITSWSVVGREAQGVRIVIQLPSGVPMSLDGVVTFAIPGQGLALVSVNPDLYLASYKPLLLPLATRIAVGQEVYSIASTFSDQDTNSFAVGHIRESSFTGIGTITDVQTTIPFYPASAGAPIIRKSDGAVVSIVQYQNTYPPFVPTDDVGFLKYYYSAAIASTASSGVSASMLRSFLTQAGTATNNGAPVVGAGYFPGAVTYPTLRDNYALGMILPAGEEQEGEFLFDAAVPLIAAGIQPQQLSVGAPSIGALVYDPALTLVTDNNIGTGTLILNSNGAVYGNYTAMDVGYVRALRPYVDIRSEGGTQLEMNKSLGTLTLTYSLDGKKFVYASDSDGGNIESAAELTVCSFGIVGAYNISLENTYSFIEGLNVYPNIISPFASTDFILPPNEIIAGPSADLSALNYSSTKCGTPGYPLSVWKYENTDATQVTFQWDGYSLKTGDPVSFQAVLSIGDDTDPAVGQVQFNYGTMPGSWSGGKWVAGTNTTANPNNIKYIRGDWPHQLINVVDQPRTGESIYFGRSSLQSSMQLPLAANVSSVLESIQNRVAAPALLPNSTLPPLAVATHYPVVNTPLPPPASDQTRVVSGTICQYDSDTDIFTYNLVTYTWAATPIQITSIAGNSIGTVALNVPSLTDAIIATGKIGGTQAFPLTVTGVKALSLNNGTILTLTLSQRIGMVQSTRSLGIPPTVNYSLYPLQAKFDWAPADGVYYTSTVLYAPFATGTRTIPNILSAEILISFNPADLFTLAGEVLTPTKVIVVQLAATDSTSLLTQFGDSANSCVVIYGGTFIDGVYTYYYQYRSGYGVIGVESLVQSGGTPTTTFTANLIYNTTSNYAQRPNAIVVGHPSRAGNDQWYSPYNNPPSLHITPTAPPTPDLAPATFELSSIRVAPMDAVSIISDKNFAITTERNAVSRPSSQYASPLISVPRL